jgi:hypothetical protein
MEAEKPQKGIKPTMKKRDRYWSLWCLPLLVLFAMAVSSNAAFAQLQNNNPDLNHDGDTDIIWQNTSTGDVSVWYMHGQTWMGNWDYIARGIPTEWKLVGTTDVNFDGNTDLIWQNNSTGDVTVWYMNGATWTGNWAYLGRGVPLQWKIVAIADLNADGQSDLIWQNTQTGDVAYWIINGTNQGGTGFIANNIPLDWKVAGSADLNNDGKADLIWQNTTTGDVVVWYMNGISWSGNYDYIAHNVPTQWSLVGVMSISNVYPANLVWRNTTTGDVTVWDMSGATWTGNWGYIAQGVPLVWQIVRPH